MRVQRPLVFQAESVDHNLMKTLNRFALIVRPAGPFIEWAAKAFGEPIGNVQIELGEMEPNIYLLPESNAADLGHPTVLKAHWQAIFKEELEGWCTDKKTWPQSLSEDLFRAWFKLDFCTMVYDRGKEPLALDS